LLSGGRRTCSAGIAPFSEGIAPQEGLLTERTSSGELQNSRVLFKTLGLRR